MFSTLARTAAVARGWRSVAHWFALTAVVVLLSPPWVGFGSVHVFEQPGAARLVGISPWLDTVKHMTLTRLLKTTLAATAAALTLVAPLSLTKAVSVTEVRSVSRCSPRIPPASNRAGAMGRWSSTWNRAPN